MSDPEEGYDDDIVFELYTEQTVKELKARVAGLEAAITWALGAGELLPAPRGWAGCLLVAVRAPETRWPQVGTARSSSLNK